MGLSIIKLRRFVAESDSENFFKPVNIWQSYKQIGGCLVHFLCLDTTLLEVEESARHNLRFARNYARYLPISKVFLTDSTIKTA